jgi:hypothetical protein
LKIKAFGLSMKNRVKGKAPNYRKSINLKDLLWEATTEDCPIHAGSRPEEHRAAENLVK